MKNIILLYDHCCIYEIVILNYFLNFTNQEVVFCSIEGNEIYSMEGYSIKVDMSIRDIDFSNIRSFILPGGNVKNIDTPAVLKMIAKLHEQDIFIAGICAGVDILDKAGILNHIRSTHSTEEDCVFDGNILTARANAYVDFAIEAAKILDLFESEADLQETIDFWKNYKRIQ
ncbi:MAG: DJ-1/PfpI family protein [Lachnospiraceae bacterium]